MAVTSETSVESGPDWHECPKVPSGPPVVGLDVKPDAASSRMVTSAWASRYVGEDGIGIVGVGVTRTTAQPPRPVDEP
jgi:hypothetical protein